MKKHILIMTILLLALLYGDGQAQVTFQKTYGVGKGQCVQRTNDKGFIILGNAQGGSSGISLIKTDSLGVVQSSNYYTEGSNALYGYSVQQTRDSGFIVTGTLIYSSITNQDIILFKTGPNLNLPLQWKKYFNYTSSAQYGFSVLQTNDGGFILTGYTTDAVLIKTTANGSLQWTKTISNMQIGNCIQQTLDGGFIIAGNTLLGAGNFDVSLVKTDSGGSVKWAKTFGGIQNDLGNSVKQTTDGGYVIAGTTVNYGAGQEDIYLIKTDTSGNLQWTKTYGGTLNEEGKSVLQTNDGGYIITGSTNSFGTGSYDAYLVKTDTGGALQWSKTFGGSNDEMGNSIVQAHDNGFVINAFTTSSFALYSTDIYLIKTDNNGNSACYETSPTTLVGTGGVQGTGNNISIIDTTGLTGNQFIVDNFGSSANIICSTVGIDKTSDNFQTSISPNPFSSSTNLTTNLADLTVTIYNLCGQPVKQIKTNSQQTVLNRDNLPSGLYFLRVTKDNKTVASDKLVIVDN